MFRAVSTLVLVIAAISLALTARGAALLGGGRSLIVTALVILGALQAARLARMWQIHRRGELANRVPKRPLGL